MAPGSRNTTTTKRISATPANPSRANGKGLVAQRRWLLWGRSDHTRFRVAAAGISGGCGLPRRWLAALQTPLEEMLRAATAIEQLRLAKFIEAHVHSGPAPGPACALLPRDARHRSLREVMERHMPVPHTILRRATASGNLLYVCRQYRTARSPRLAAVTASHPPTLAAVEVFALSILGLRITAWCSSTATRSPNCSTLVGVRLVPPQLLARAAEIAYAAGSSSRGVDASGKTQVFS